MTTPLLDIAGLELRLRGKTGTIPLVEDLDLHIGSGESVGLVGESGCGKSITALAIMRLLPRGKIWPAAGTIRFDRQDLLALPEASMRQLRGNRIAMIFQEPMTSLHPLFPIGAQIGEALACEPRLLIADEPTTALDVTIQAQIMRLIDELRRELGMAMLLITHDLGVVAAHCERVCVMYAGRVVERADSADLLAHPRHRYTEGLIGCVPTVGHKVDYLPTIAGTVPPLEDRGQGCRFAPRCAHALDRCAAETPPLRIDPADHAAACWNPPA